MSDILKIQKAIRKAITDYSIEGKREKEALIALMSVDMYLALEEKEVVPPKSKPIVHLEKANAQA